MSLQSRSIPIVAMLAATAAWGSLFHVGKWVIGQIDPFWFTALRYVFATLVLLVVLHYSGVIRWCLMRRHWQSLTLYGVLGYGVFSLMVFIGLSMSVPAHGAVIMA